MQEKDESEIGPESCVFVITKLSVLLPGVQAGSGEVRSACRGGFERDLECIVLCIFFFFFDRPSRVNHEAHM